MRLVRATGLSGIAAAMLAAALAQSSGAVTSSGPSLRIKTCVFSSSSERVAFLGRGFTPGVPFKLKDGAHALVQGRVDTNGDARAVFRAPTIGTGPRQQVKRLLLTDGTRRVAKAVTFVNFGARITPSPTGRSPRDRFRFQMFGFLPGGRVYLHYVKPNGRLAATYVMGFPRGACGTLISARRVLFPFPAITGNWRLQFDKRMDYSRNAPAPRERIVLPIRRARR